MKEKKIEDWIKKKQEHRSKMTPIELFDGILAGDITALSSGITLVESQLQGITGVPGVGKSTFIEAFGKVLSESHEKVAVLAVDPSSGVSGGSILGDKTRMNELSVTPNVFIRPSAAGSKLGGVARKTRETILLCEAAGFSYIIIETVGVGQSETLVKSMVDFFLLLMLSGAGDELQGIKKGIMEMADALVITKADGDNESKAKIAAREYKNAMHLFPPNANDWIPKVYTCSALTGANVDKTIEVISSFSDHVKGNGHFDGNRRVQDKLWLRETLKELILSDFFANEELNEELKLIEQAVLNGEMTSFQGAEKIHEFYKKKNGRI
jgi:LAO/AO transport system kinase